MARSRHNVNYRKNHGVSGVVYILDNPGLRDGFYKIGCSRISGSKRANDLNNDANTGTPGTFRCIFEYRTKNCGKAEERVFEKLSNHRQGKWGQEFFSIDLAVAKETITKVCKEIDAEVDRNPPTVKPAPPIVTTRPDSPSITHSTSGQTLGTTTNNVSKTDRLINHPVVNVISLIIVSVLIVKWCSPHHHRSVVEQPSQASTAYVAPSVQTPHGFVPLEQATPSTQPDQQAPEDVTGMNSASGTPRHQFVAGKEVDYQLREATPEEIQGGTTETPPEPKVQMTKAELENLNTCLDGRYKSLCKHNLLTPEQSSQVADAERSANLKSCSDGRYPALCDHRSLSDSEAADVDLAERRANFKSCIDGRYPALCNHSRLSETESVSVKEAEARENLKVCMDGRYPGLCNHSLLKADEAVKVRINEGGR
jgi:hypothetical protein